MTGKIAFVFPGQGSQYPGMGQELVQKYEVARQVFAAADSKKPLSQLCFTGPEEELRQTINTQPALLTVSTAFARILGTYGVRPDYVVGHSLGEYSALVAAGSLDFSKALDLVLLRSQLMEETVPADAGGMAAILGLGGAEVAALCKEIAPQSWVEPANYNCPGQVVISGYREGVTLAMGLAKERGAKRVLPLAVSGPFHSRLMEPASLALATRLAQVSFNYPKMPVVANVTAQFAIEPGQIADNLGRQVSQPVLWEESIRLLHQNGVNIFIEVGPGKVLSGLIKKIVKNCSLLNVEDEASLQATVQKLQEVRECS